MNEKENEKQARNEEKFNKGTYRREGRKKGKQMNEKENEKQTRNEGRLKEKNIL